jgi:hypothetical protein
MVWKRQVLVVANVTAASDELLAELDRRSGETPTGFTLLIPAGVGAARQAAAERLEGAVAGLRERGLDVEGVLGDGDPLVAVAESWDPQRYDEIVVSTLPVSVSKWLHADLPHRIERQTGAIVKHIVAHPPPAEPHTVPAPAPEHHGVLTPLTVLSWGARPAQPH